jgi:hypothetical protein
MVQDIGVQTSSADTPISAVQSLKPSNTTEWSDASALFDEARCVGFTFFVMCGIAGGNGSAAGTSAGFAFDPINNTAYSAIAEMIVVEHGISPILLQQTTSTPSSWGAAGPVTKTGYLKWGAKVSPGPTLNPGTSTEIVGGSWFGIQDSGPIVGYLKPFVEQAGGTATTWYRALVVYHMEFRTRS